MKIHLFRFCESFIIFKKTGSRDKYLYAKCAQISRNLDKRLLHDIQS